MGEEDGWRRLEGLTIRMWKKNNMIPMVIDAQGERAYDIYSRLIKDRIIFMGEAIYDETASSVVAQLLYLHMQNKKQTIHMYINSPGGSVTAGLAIYDTMKYVNCDVATYCIGQAASMGAVLLAGGTKGKRFALPSSRIMIHQPWGGAGGSASDIEIQSEEIKRLKADLNNKLANDSGQDIEVMKKKTDRDNFFSAEEAVKFGLVDEVITSISKGKDGEEGGGKKE